MVRYQVQLARLVDELSATAAGIGVIEYPVSERAAVVAALRQAMPEALVTPLSLAQLGAPPATGPWLVTLEPDATATIEALNRARDALALRLWVVLIVDRQQHVLLQRGAPDLVAGTAFVLRLNFEPDAQVDLVAAQAQLTSAQTEAFGRLDLRGLARSEGEDVAFSVLDIYQDLERALPSPPSLELGGGLRTEATTELLVDYLRRAKRPRREVVLGAPGSGKSFFLRWLAVAPHTLGGVYAVAVLLPVAALGPSAGLRPLEARAIDYLLEVAPLAAHALDVWAQEGRLTWLIDGLDETGDRGSREVMVASLEAFAKRWSRCDVIVTSRVAGYDEAPLSDAFGVSQLAPLSPGAVERFLVQWLTLYARQARGTSPQVDSEARAQAQALASDVLASDSLRALAQTPLLLTLIAILQRTGLQLPRSRVELYEHITRVLVERWNRVRSRAEVPGAPPIGVSDALRLLGPLALASIRRMSRGQFSEAELRATLESRVGRAPLAVGSVDDAVMLFQRTLGILVETAPGMFGFLHLTLAEYFAARELVRTGGLEEIVADPARVFRPEWREVVLLAAGELGVLRADDMRLERVVLAIVGSVRKSPAASADILVLLFGLLADDPNLADPSVDALLELAVPLAVMDGSWRIFVLAQPLFTTQVRVCARWAQVLSRALASPSSMDWTRRHLARRELYDSAHWAVLCAHAGLDLSEPVAAALRAGGPVVTYATDLSRGPEPRVLVAMPKALGQRATVDGRPIAVWLPRPDVYTTTPLDSLESFEVGGLVWFDVTTLVGPQGVAPRPGEGGDYGELLLVLLNTVEQSAGEKSGENTTQPPTA